MAAWRRASGQVLGEQVIYGDDGQLLTASFMDYFMPRAGRHAALCPCTTTSCPAPPTRSA